MTTDQQIHALQKVVRRNVLAWIARILSIISIILLFVFAIEQHPQYLIGGLCTSLIAFSAYHGNPHIKAAVKALDNANIQQLIIKIAVDDESETTKYFLITPTNGTQHWQIAFIPIGWKPVSGEYLADVYYLPTLKWPALVKVENGIIYPRVTPKLV
ncbi:hypothetical protein LIN78_15290 [Leeia sp. TBRC 13508]|uniref:Uncharacterized protein n=1 Tax=Leeia speluncae TaxID=2884804 RepID=A0ABS8D9L7_9NEIS|nr:hypothetical protein [Leeia speluncae]MCB6184911.1 hypothetical protein [Leeia speluncae]